MSDFFKSANDALKSISDPENSSDIATTDGSERLKIRLFEFFDNHIKKVERKERLAEKIENRIEAMVDEEDGLEFDQLMRVLRELSSQSSISSDSLISIFKPTPGTPSILADTMGRRLDSDGSERDFMKDMNQDKIADFEALMKLARQFRTNSSEEDELL